MSKLQRQSSIGDALHAHDEMYEVAYLKSILPDCRICKHDRGQTYKGVELVCAVHPYGYKWDSCLDLQVKKRLLRSR